MKRKLGVALLAIFVLMGCTTRSHTGMLWNKVDEFVIIEEKHITAEQNNMLKNKIGPDVKYDGVGRYYVRQSIMHRSIKVPLVVMITPFTMMMDGASWVVTGFVDMGSGSGREYSREESERSRRQLAELLVGIVNSIR